MTDDLITFYNLIERVSYFCHRFLYFFFSLMIEYFPLTYILGFIRKVISDSR